MVLKAAPEYGERFGTSLEWFGVVWSGLEWFTKTPVPNHTPSRTAYTANYDHDKKLKKKILLQF
jgi:hypothetical protein